MMIGTLPLRAVIFDMDGTLINSLPVSFAAFRATLKQYLGRDYTDAEIEGMFGPDEPGIFQRLLPDRWQEAYRDFLSEYDSRHAQLCPAPFPGIVSLLDQLRVHSVQVAIVTGKGADTAAMSLRHTGLSGHFDIVESGSASGAVKPAAIADILRRWFLTPADAAYVGDTAYDVRAAREAHVTPLSVLWAPTVHRDRIAAEHPAAMFETPVELEAWLGRRAGFMTDE